VNHVEVRTQGLAALRRQVADVADVPPVAVERQAETGRPVLEVVGRGGGDRRQHGRGTERVRSLVEQPGGFATAGERLLAPDHGPAMPGRTLPEVVDRLDRERPGQQRRGLGRGNLLRLRRQAAGDTELLQETGGERARRELQRTGVGVGVGHRAGTD